MADLSKVLAEAIFPESLYSFLGSEVSETVVSGFIVVLAIAMFALIVRVFVIPKFKIVPKGFQVFIEWIVTAFDSSAKTSTGHLAKFLGPYTFSVAAYICVGVLVELVGVRPIVADINTCLALSLSTFFLINFFAFKTKGVAGRVKYYIKPMVMIAPVKLVTDLAVPVSMALRLFASVLSGMLVMELLYNVVFLAFVVPSVLSIVFTLFHALMQAYIFSTLTLAFIGEATE